MADDTPFGEIGTDTPAAWKSSQLTAVDRISNPIQLPLPTPADSRERTTAKQSNTFAKAFQRINEWANGVYIFGSAITQLIRVAGGFLLGDSTTLTTGDASPEGVVTANRGSVFLRRDGGTGTTIYVKEADDGGATGWVALGAGGGGGGIQSREAINGFPSFGGTPTDPTISLSPDEVISFNDDGGFIGGGTMTMSLAPIGSFVEAGQKAGILLPEGNGFTAMAFVPDAADLIIDPATGNPVGPPGTPLVIPSGTNTDNTAYVFEGVASFIGTVWMLWTDRKGSGGGGASSWSASLAIGADSDGQSAYMSPGDLFVIGAEQADFPGQGQVNGNAQGARWDGIAHSFDIGTGGQGTPVYLKGPNFVENTNPSLFPATVTVEYNAVRYTSNDGINPPSIQGVINAKERWTLSNGGATKDADVYPPDSAQIGGNDAVRIVQGTNGRSLAFEVLDSVVNGDVVTTNIHYRLTVNNNTTSF